MTEKELRINMGKRIKQIRLQKKWTQQEFAEYLGVSVPMISNLENGKKSICLYNLLKCSEILGVSTDWVIKGE